MAKSKSKLTLNDHREAGARLKSMSEDLLRLSLDLQRVYGKRDEYKSVQRALRCVTVARVVLDSRVGRDYPDMPDSDLNRIYYPWEGRTPSEDYLQLAKRNYPNAEWIRGNGRYALLAPCRVLTISLYASMEDALHQKSFIDKTGCGGQCNPCEHEIVDLGSNETRT